MSFPDGNVAEGPGFNVFCVKAGQLSTPAIGVLPGITRRTVFDLCAEAGLAAAPADVSVAALKGADEVFITSTAGGIMPVTVIDGAPVADGKIGAITSRLMARYGKSMTTRPGRSRCAIPDQPSLLLNRQPQKESPSPLENRGMHRIWHKRRSLRFHPQFTARMGKDSTS